MAQSSPENLSNAEKHQGPFWFTRFSPRQMDNPFARLHRAGSIPPALRQPTGNREAEHYGGITQDARRGPAALGAHGTGSPSPRQDLHMEQGVHHPGRICTAQPSLR